METILIAIFLTIYLFMISRVNGSLNDKIIIFVTRLLFLCACVLLLFSSKFETSYRNYLQSKFLYLIDDSYSSSLSSNQELLDRRLSSLREVLDISKKNFSQGEVPPLYSISKQLNYYAQSKKYKAIFLQSDGLEIGDSLRVDLGLPVFTIPNESKLPKNIYGRISKGNHKFSKNQKVHLSLELTNNFTANARGSVDLVLDDKVLLSQEYDINKESISLDFEFKLKEVGLHKLVFKVNYKEKVAQNLEYFVEVVDQEKNILFVGKNLSRDSAFYLRALSQLDSVNVFTHYMDFTKESKDLKSIDLVCLYDLSTAQLNEISKLYSLQDTPKVLIISDQRALPDFSETSFEDLSKVAGSKESPILERQLYIESDSFAPFRLFEHEAFQKDLMNSFNSLDSAKFKLELPNDWESVFGYKSGNERSSLISINRRMNRANAVIFNTSLSQFVFSPLFHKDQNKFFTSMVNNLFSWALDFDRLKGLEIESSVQNSIVGDKFYLKVRSKENISVLLKNLDTGIINFQQQGEMDWAGYLKIGNYALEIASSKGLIERKLFHVSMDFKEIVDKSIDTKYLKNISDLSGGKYLSSDVEDLSGYIPFQLKEKKLELVRKEVDLQENYYYLLLMIFLLCFEWIYRFQRRLV